MAGYRTIALTVSTAVFMQFLDATALNTALPAIGRDLHVPAVELDVAILGYQLALAAFIPAGNMLAGRIGARNTFIASLLVFMAGSLCCALSRSLVFLVVSRVFQGLGGAVMMPVSRQMVVSSARRDELVSAMNWLLTPGIIGPLLGPVLGGLIVTYASWHWIFLINLPIALLGISMALYLVPHDAGRDNSPIDITGVGLVAITVACLIFGLEGLSQAHIGTSAPALLMIGLLTGGIYVRHARGNPQAVLDLSLLQIASFRHSMAAGTVLRTLLGASGFLMPLWFQLAMGMNAAQSGLLLVSSTFGALLSRLVGTLLMRYIHPRPVAIGGVVCLVLILWLLPLGARLPHPAFAVLLLMQGVAISTAMMIISAVAYVDIPSERLSAATGLYTTVQQLTLSLGVTAGVWMISVMRWLRHSGPNDGQTYHGSFMALAGVAVLGIYATSRLSHASLGALRRRETAGQVSA